MAMPLLVMILLDKPLHNQAFEAGFADVGKRHILFLRNPLFVQQVFLVDDCLVYLLNTGNLGC